MEGGLTSPNVPLPPHVQPDKDRHGNPRLYYRVGKGPRIRLRVLPGHPDFEAAVAAAARGETWIPGKGASAPADGPAPGSFRALATAWFASDDFTELDPQTRAKRRAILESCFREKLRDAAAEIMADCPVKYFGRDHVERLRRLKRETPEAANQRVKVIRRLFNWAIEQKPPRAAANPAAGVVLRGSTTGGWHTWTIGEVEQYRARWPLGTKARLALDILLFTGLRVSDARRFGRPHVRGDWAAIDQWKGRNRSRTMLEFPILPELRESLDAAAAKGLTFLVTDYGKPYATPKSFGNAVRKWCDAAGLPHCSAHGLRKAGATFAAENGASAHALMAIYAWKKIEQAEDYTLAADRKRLARENMALIAPQSQAPSPSPERGSALTSAKPKKAPIKSRG